jgi:hypothetical protein
MKMKLFKPVLITALIFCLPLLFSSCAKKQNNRTDLVKKNGLLYKSGGITPYTGREKAQVSGRIIEYDVVKGMKNGNFKVSYSEGKPQIIGQVVNDKNEGFWKYFYENSQVESEGNFKNDIPEGNWTFYYFDGKVKENGNYVLGKRDGKWISYEENGKIADEKHFKDGEAVTGKK